MYEYLKIIHVISASILIGTSVFTTLYMWLANKHSKQLLVDATSQGLFCNLILTGVSGAMLAITGFIMVGLKGYGMSSFWLIGSIVGYFIIGTFWLPAFFLQLYCRDLAKNAISEKTALPKDYSKHYLTWRVLSVLALLTMMVVFYLMTGFRHHLG